MFAEKSNKVPYSYHFSFRRIGPCFFSSFLLLRMMCVKYLMAIRECIHEFMNFNVGNMLLVVCIAPQIEATYVFVRYVC